MLDFSGVPIVDAHAHPFMPTREKEDYSYAYSMCIHKGLEDFRYLTSYQMALQEYKRLFHFAEDSTEQEIIERRNSMALEDYSAFVKKLYRDAGIVSVISDFGFPITGDGLKDCELKIFDDALAGICQVYDLIRIETTCDRLLYCEGRSFEEMVQMFDSYVENHIKSHSTGSKNDQKDHSREHYVPVQSCISQETGNRCQYISHSYKSSKSCQQLCFYICAVGRQLKLFFKPFFH